jgi:plasmid stabilization system protein ParE
MKLRVGQRAQLELLDAADYLCAEGGKELGARFEAEIMRAYRLISEFPQIGKKQKNGLRLLSCPDFSYSIVYSIGREHINIVGVVHQRRHPDVWRYRNN